MPFFSASGISPYNKTSGGAAAPLPDASAYIIAAGITDPTEQAAATQFVLDLSGRGSTTNNTNQWSKHYALYPMSPTTLNAAAYNIKDPTEYKITWYNNPTHSLNGVSGNGVDQYGDTNFNLANDTASLNISIGAWISANNTLAQADMGAQNSSSPNSGAMLFPYNAGTHDASTVGEYTGGTTPMSTDRDEFMLVQNNGTNLQKFRNGVSYYNAPQALGTADSNNTFILARNLNGANALSSKGTSFNNISEHLTQNEITDLYDAMNTYNVSMSRSWTDPDADAWIAAGSVTDPTEKAAVNQFALDLKGTGSTPNNSDIWNSLHWINLVSATSLAASLNDLKGGYNLTAYNSPTWSQNGIMGNGSNMYLLTSYIAQNNGSTLNSNSFGCAVRTTQTNTGASFMGVRNASTIPYNAMVLSGGSRYYGNNSSFALDSGAGQFPSGDFVNNRTNSSNFNIYFNNVLDFTGTATTNALASIGMGILCQNNDGTIGGFSDMEFTVAFEGEGLTANQMEDLNASINTLNANIIAGGRSFTFGNSLLFDGVNDYVTTRANTFNNLFYNPSDLYTVSGWFNPTNISSYPMLLSKSVANEFFLELGNTAGVVYWRNGGNIRTYNSTGWTLNAWNHYAIVKNGIGDSGDLYINGLLQTPTVGVIGTTINSPNEHLVIGAYWNGTTNKFGRMDETAIWNGTAATQQNITDLYNNGNGALASSIIANPTAYWRFNESGADIILTDETTNYPGDLINFPTSGMWVAHTP